MPRILAQASPVPGPGPHRVARTGHRSKLFAREGRRIAPKGLRRDLRIRFVRAAADKLAALEKLIDDACFAKRISRQEYVDYASDFKAAWEALGRSYDAELYDSRAPVGLEVAKTVTVERRALDFQGRPADAPPGLQIRLEEIERAMREGALEVYCRMSATIGRRIGPLAAIRMVRNDDPRLGGSICGYDRARREIVISNLCQTPPQIWYAVALAVSSHVYEHAPQAAKDSLSRTFFSKIDPSIDVKTAAFGETAPYWESRAFWMKGMGVVPTVTRDGLSEIDVTRGGKYLSMAAFATVTGPNGRLLGRVMRDPEWRKTLFSSMKIFNTIAVKGGKIK